MKHLLTILAFTLLAVSTAIHAAIPEKSFNVEFYRGFLNPGAKDYPSRRQEALEKISSFTRSEQNQLHNIIVQKDVTFLSYTRQFRELWDLRYQNKWEPETLLVIADTAKFYIRFYDTKLQYGLNEDVGILHHILKQLRETDGIKAKIAFRELATEIKKLRDANIIDENIQLNRAASNTMMNSDMQELQNTLDRNYINALKSALQSAAVF